MRAVVLLSALLSLAGCVAPPLEPGLAGYLHILESTRAAREACAGLRPDCAAGNMDDTLAHAEAETPRNLLLPPEQAEAERDMAEAAFQAAFADCRGRGITPGTPRWDRCRLDRGIARLNEVAGLH
jgi:hypothetical protein